MPSHRISARRPRGIPRLNISRDPDKIGSHLEDAARFPGGHASEIVFPASEADVAEALRTAGAVLPIGAQSSLTGGATPHGERLVSTEHLRFPLELRDTHVRVGAGFSLVELDEALKSTGRYYPPGPTFTGAFVGGMLATNAAGAATFKYGTTRNWVDAVTVVLVTGDVLDIERGQVTAHAGGYFELELSTGTIVVPLPSYRMPRVPKTSAGYFAAPAMDLLDLFVGSEGTLGVITEATLRIVPRRPSFCLAFVPFETRAAGLTFAERLRHEAATAWWDTGGIDVSAIEHLDARSLSVVREDGRDRATGVPIPEFAAMALLVTIELPPGTTGQQAYDEIGRGGEPGGSATTLTRFCELLNEAGVFDAVSIAVPGDEAGRARLIALREAVPEGVNRRVGHVKAAADARIEKTAADVVVPVERLEELLNYCDAAFMRHGLDAAVWGHISDGNIHPNVLPRSYADVQAGKTAMLEIGREAIRLGGSPLAEHGVGRNAVKQQLLRDLYGQRGIEEMRRVKRALDPEWKLSPGVIFDQ